MGNLTPTGTPIPVNGHFHSVFLLASEMKTSWVLSEESGALGNLIKSFSRVSRKQSQG